MKFREWKDSAQFEIFVVESRNDLTVNVKRICDGKIFRMHDVVLSSMFGDQIFVIHYFCHDEKTVLLESMKGKKGYESKINEIKHKQKFISPGI